MSDYPNLGEMVKERLSEVFTLEKEDLDSELPDYSSGSAHWYDGILYPCSYAKTGKGLSQRMNAAAQDYLDQYMELVKAAPDCDVEAKKAKVEYFAKTLFSEGGPAVDQVKNLFGDEIAGRLILRHMYGI